jgi:hypothetical protein
MALWLVVAFLAGLVGSHALLDGTLGSDGGPSPTGDERAPFVSSETYRVDQGQPSPIGDRIDPFERRGLRAR